jgi:Mg2+-importing ATPase
MRRDPRVPESADTSTNAQGRIPPISELATIGVPAVLDALGTSSLGLRSEEAAERLRTHGPNAVRSHKVHPFAVLARQFANPIEVLLLGAAGISIVVGDRTDAAIVAVIVLLTVALGFVNELRSEQAVADLHDRIRHTVTARRDGADVEIDVTDLVPGDIVRLELGQIVPADIRLVSAEDFECDEAVLTGESTPVSKGSEPTPPGESPLDLGSCALMGTVVQSGSAVGVVAFTGGETAFGAIALKLGERHERTGFENGLRAFTNLLVRITGVLVLVIVAINLLRGRPFLDTALFALAVAVGLTPQLLPALVTVSLAQGSRTLTKAGVVVKRLVAIEDLGNVDVLFTDKTGTLTAGRIVFERAVDPDAHDDDDVLRLARECTDVTLSSGRATGGNPLDRALWDTPGETTVQADHIALLPFDPQRQLMAVLVDDPDRGRIEITKGAPEAVLARCTDTPEGVSDMLDGLFADGTRVVAVATRPAPGREVLGFDSPNDFRLAGFATFLDPPKADVATSVASLRDLGITVKVVTGDNPLVAAHLCAEIGIPVEGTLTGTQIDELDDAGLASAIADTTIFGRVTPDQKARILRAERSRGSTVAFLGDGVNDAVALHTADVGISVDTATDVAKDAASVVLVRKDLGVLADGVVEGRRIFTNTMKYVLMATSSNFGNMFSLVGASLIVPFLPLLPTQVLLNNLLYDTSQLSIPVDNVDEEQLRRPSHWDVGFIRRFMEVFGPLSSAFDFATFAVLILAFGAGTNPTLFRSGWFVESLLTQTLVVFVVRTRRWPFWRSRPAKALLFTTLSCAVLAVAFPFGPLSGAFGFEPLSAALMGTIVLLAAAYLILVDLVKRWFYRHVPSPAAAPTDVRTPHRRRIERRAARFTHG